MTGFMGFLGLGVKQTAARVGLAPTLFGLTNRRATLTPPGNGAAGRVPTCMIPIRSRMPDNFDHGGTKNWSARQELHLRSPGPKPGALLLRHALKTPAGNRNAGAEKRNAINLGQWHRGKILQEN